MAPASDESFHAYPFGGAYLQGVTPMPIVPAGYGSLSPRAVTSVSPEPAKPGQFPLSDLHDHAGNIESDVGTLSNRASLAGEPNPVQYVSGGSLVSTPSMWAKARQTQFDGSPGEIVVLPDGSTIPDPNPRSRTGKVMSPVADLYKVAMDGKRTGEIFRAMLNNPETSAGAAAYLYATLIRNLGQGGIYDHQRRGNMISGYTQLPQFRPIANINVGLFSQQAGLTLDEALEIAGLYAKYFSSNASRDNPHGLDPVTLQFIKHGYEIGRSGMFDSSDTL